MGFVIGFEGRGSVRGPAPVMLTTLYDATLPQYGFKYSGSPTAGRHLSLTAVKEVLWYLGWRPASGGVRI